MSSEFNNPFLLPAEHYTRDISPVKHYVEQAAHFLHTSKGIDLSKARELVIEKIKNREFPRMRDPMVTYLYRDEDTGDRRVERISLSRYIGEVIKNREIMAPTMTTYMPPDKQSEHSGTGH